MHIFCKISRKRALESGFETTRPYRFEIDIFRLDVKYRITTNDWTEVEL